jgi:hypothetical protein
MMTRSGYSVHVRAVKLVILLAAGCLAAMVAVGALQNLVGYRDGAVSTYLLIGLPALVFAVAAFVAAWQLLRR